MEWEIVYHDEFDSWLCEQLEDLQDEILKVIGLLALKGPQLSRPYADHIKGSSLKNLKELRIQWSGDPYRVLFAFDPQRNAILLLGGNKAGDKRWYDKNIPVAEKRFVEHLKSLEEENCRGRKKK